MKIRRVTLEGRKAFAGRLFVYPWVIGFLVFFAQPLIQSLIYTFNEIQLTPTGLQMKYLKFENYVYAFTKDPTFIETLTGTLVSMAIDLPLIILFSLFVAVLLNQKFRGRTFVRAAFFLPVILTSGALVYVLSTNMGMNDQFTGGAAASAMPMLRTINFQAVLLEATNNVKAVQPIIQAMDRVYVIMWKSGVQILLFLAGLQSISPSLYESADVEGATGWESFWMITFPMISPIIIINITYTIIDSFTDYNNAMLRFILDIAFGRIQYGYGSAVAWIYFLFIFAVLGIVMGFVSKKVFYINE